MNTNAFTHPHHTMQTHEHACPSTHTCPFTHTKCTHAYNMCMHTHNMCMHTHTTHACMYAQHAHTHTHTPHPPAGLTCLKEAAAGRPRACLSSETNCQALRASHRLMKPGEPFTTERWSKQNTPLRRTGSQTQCSQSYNMKERDNA